MTKLDRREHVINGVYVNENGDRVQLVRVEYDIKLDTQIAYFIEPSGTEDHITLSTFLDEYTLETEAEKPLATEIESPWYAKVKDLAQQIDVLIDSNLLNDEDPLDEEKIKMQMGSLAELLIELSDRIAALNA